MRSDRTLVLGAAVLAALSLAPAAAEDQKDWLSWGADLACAQKFITNVGPQ